MHGTHTEYETEYTETKLLFNLIEGKSSSLLEVAQQQFSKKRKKNPYRQNMTFKADTKRK